MTLELKKRVLTGAVGAVAVLSLLIFGGWLGIFCLATIISLGMIFEFAEITLSLPDRIEKRYVLLILTWLIAILNLLFPQTEFGLASLSFLLLFCYFLLTAQRHAQVDLLGHFRELMCSVFGFIYLVFIPFYFLKISGAPNGGHWIIVFFLLVWAGDSGAYFIGKKYGAHKLYPVVSPKKSIEGSIGGLVSGFIVILIYKWLRFSGISWLAVFFIPIFVGIFSQLGDLCESLLKRAFNRKDSGTILPGHGGFLDRFDGMVFSLPVMYACVKVFG